jgi:hypothetical protein
MYFFTFLNEKNLVRFLLKIKALSFDPFGYYKKRLLSDRYPEQNMPYFEDYPMNDSHWNIFETFPEGAIAF